MEAIHVVEVQPLHHDLLRACRDVGADLGDDLIGGADEDLPGGMYVLHDFVERLAR